VEDKAKGESAAERTETGNKDLLSQEQVLLQVGVNGILMLLPP
jgi:hypothetical protein